MNNDLAGSSSINSDVPVNFHSTDEFASCSENPYFSVKCEQNGDGRIHRKIEQGPDFEDVFEYRYDSARHLCGVMHNGVQVEEYRYNQKGQRVFQKSLWSHAKLDLNLQRHLAACTIGGATLSYNSLGQLERFNDIQSFAYDTQGNLVRSEIVHIGRKTIYRYIDKTCLESVSLPSGDEIRFEYSAMGEASVCPSRKFRNGELVAEYRWAAPDRLIYCLDHVQGLEFHFNYTGKRHCPASIDLGILRATQTNLRLLTLFNQNTSATLLCGCDQAGTLKLFSDESGNSIKRIQYDSFGGIASDTLPQLHIPMGFGAGLYDNELGMVRFGYRVYDPVVGRFICPDPLGYTGGDRDLYDFCTDDPVNMIDPMGLRSRPWHEEDHPRDEIGRFADKGSGGAAVKSGEVQKAATQAMSTHDAHSEARTSEKKKELHNTAKQTQSEKDKKEDPSKMPTDFVDMAVKKKLSDAVSLESCRKVDNGLLINGGYSREWKTRLSAENSSFVCLKSPNIMGAFVEVTMKRPGSKQSHTQSVFLRPFGGKAIVKIEPIFGGGIWEISVSSPADACLISIDVYSRGKNVRQK